MQELNSLILNVYVKFAHASLNQKHLHESY